MSRRDDVPVGGVLTRKNGKEYLVIADPSTTVDLCDVCAFSHKSLGWCSEMKCAPRDRGDNTGVFFIKIKTPPSEIPL